MKLAILLLSTAFVLFVNSEPIPKAHSTITVTITTTVTTKTVTWSAKTPIGFTSGKASPTTSLQLSAISSSAKPSPTYPHGYPLCKVANSLLRPGGSFAIPIMHQESGSNLQRCIQECKDDYGSSASNSKGKADISRGPCLSILYEDRYTMCLFYDVNVEDTAQIVDDRYRYTSWDKDC